MTPTKALQDPDELDPAGGPDPRSADPGSATIHEAYGRLLAGLGEMGYPVDDENFRDTGRRGAEAMLDLVLPVAEIDRLIDDLVARSFPAKYDEMVISKHNICFGVCPHHLLPVIYRVSLAYMPAEKVLGISKLSRLARLLSRRPVLQEQLTEDLADVLHDRLKSCGSAIYIEGLHLCMATRGIEAHEARVVTSAVRGVFRNQPETRAEFLHLVTVAPQSLL